MTEIKICYNNEEYTIEELVQKLYSSEEKIKELQSKVNAYAMADAINTTYKKYEEECVRKLIKENLNKCCCDSSLSYKKVSDTFDQKEIKEMKRAIDSLKENENPDYEIDEELESKVETLVSKINSFRSKNLAIRGEKRKIPT